MWGHENFDDSDELSYGPRRPYAGVFFQQRAGHYMAREPGLSPKTKQYLKYFLLALLPLSLLGALGLAIYVSAVFIAPWIIASLTAAAVPYGFALLITILPGLIFAAPLFALLFFGIVNWLHYKKHGDINFDDLGHFKSYLENRAFLVNFFVPFSGLNFTLATFAAIGAGSYLAILIIPSFISSIAAFGAPYALAVVSGVVGALALVVLTTLFLMAPTWIFWRIYAPAKLSEFRQDPSQILPLLGLLAGLGLGAYITSLIFPIITSALASIAMPHSALIFAALIICFELVSAISFCSFALSKGLTFFFIHTDFSRFIAFLIPKKSSTQPTAKPLAKVITKSSRIQEAIAQYHQNKSFIWKFLSFISFGYYGAPQDIRRIENLLSKTDEFDEEELKRLLAERVRHTQGTRSFYTKAPNDPVNKAYMDMAKILTGQDLQEFPSMATYKVLIPDLAIEVTDAMFSYDDEEEIKAELALPDWAPGNFLVTERYREVKDDKASVAHTRVLKVVAWKAVEIAQNFKHGGFHSPYYQPAVDRVSPERLDPLTAHEHRQLAVLASLQTQQAIKAADRLDAKAGAQLPPDAADRVEALGIGFYDGFSFNIGGDAPQGGDNSLAANVNRGTLIGFYEYLNGLPPTQRVALLREVVNPNGGEREMRFSEFMFKIQGPFALEDQEPADPIASFLARAQQNPRYQEYKKLVQALVEAFNVKDRPAEAKKILSAFMQKYPAYKKHEHKLQQITSSYSLYDDIDQFLSTLDPKLFPEGQQLTFSERQLRGFLICLQTQDQYKCNQECSRLLRALAIRLPRLSYLRLDLLWEKLKGYARRAWLAAFYNEEGDIIFPAVKAHAIEHGTSIEDISLYKLANPLKCIEFLLIFFTYTLIGLVHLIVYIVTLPFTLFSLGLSNLTVGFFSSKSWIAAPIKMTVEIASFFFLSSIKFIVFLLRTLSSPIDSVFKPLQKLYNEKPLEFFTLLLLSTVVTAFLMTGFGLGTSFPALMWLSHAIFSLASLASMGSGPFMAFLALLLIILLAYETTIILDAFLIPSVKWIFSTLKEVLIFISEARFSPYHFLKPPFINRYSLELEMPTLDSTLTQVTSEVAVPATDSESVRRESPAIEEKPGVSSPGHIELKQYDDYSEEKDFKMPSRSSGREFELDHEDQYQYQYRPAASFLDRGIDLAPAQRPDQMGDQELQKYIDAHPHLFI